MKSTCIKLTNKKKPLSNKSKEGKRQVVQPQGRKGFAGASSCRPVGGSTARARSTAIGGGARHKSDGPGGVVKPMVRKLVRTKDSCEGDGERKNALVSKQEASRMLLVEEIILQWVEVLFPFLDLDVAAHNQ